MLLILCADNTIVFFFYCFSSEYSDLSNLLVFLFTVEILAKLFFFFNFEPCLLSFFPSKSHLLFLGFSLLLLFCVVVVVVLILSSATSHRRSFIVLVPPRTCCRC